MKTAKAFLNATVCLAAITAPVAASAIMQVRSSSRSMDNCVVGKVTSVAIEQRAHASTPVVVRVDSGKDHREIIFVGESSTGALGLSAALGKAARACAQPPSLQVY